MIEIKNMNYENFINQSPQVAYHWIHTSANNIAECISEQSDRCHREDEHQESGPLQRLTGDEIRWHRVHEAEPYLKSDLNKLAHNH